MGWLGNYQLKLICDHCRKQYEIIEFQTHEEALFKLRSDREWTLFGSQAFCGDCKHARQPAEIKYTTIKVVCHQCGHYLNGCYCDHFGVGCPHLNISAFNGSGIAECFNCKKHINRDREVVSP